MARVSAGAPGVRRPEWDKKHEGHIDMQRYGAKENIPSITSNYGIADILDSLHVTL